MAIFGFFVFLVITLAVSLLGVAVWTWPSAKTFSGERLFVMGVMLVMWTVLIMGNPFTVTVTG